MIEGIEKCKICKHVCSVGYKVLAAMGRKPMHPDERRSRWEKRKARRSDAAT